MQSSETKYKNNILGTGEVAGVCVYVCLHINIKKINDIPTIWICRQFVPKKGIFAT